MDRTFEHGIGDDHKGDIRLYGLFVPHLVPFQPFGLALLVIGLNGPPVPADAQDATGVPTQAVGNRETRPVRKVLPQEGDDQPLFFVEAPYAVVGKICVPHLLFPFVSEACFLDVFARHRPGAPFPQLGHELFQRHLRAAVPVGDVLVFPQGAHVVEAELPGYGPAKFGGGEAGVKGDGKAPSGVLGAKAPQQFQGDVVFGLVYADDPRVNLPSVLVAGTDVVAPFLGLGVPLGPFVRIDGEALPLEVPGNGLPIGRVPKAPQDGVVGPAIAVVQRDQVVRPTVALVDIVVMVVNVVEVPAVVLEQAAVHTEHPIFLEARAGVRLQQPHPGPVDLRQAKVLAVEELVETGLVPGGVYKHPVDGLQCLVVADDIAGYGLLEMFIPPWAETVLKERGVLLYYAWEVDQ